MLKINKFSLSIIIIILLCGFAMPSSDGDASFGDILLHHVTNDQSEETGEYLKIEIGSLNLSITKHVI